MIENIIVKSEYLISLLKELHHSKELEKYDYCIRPINDEFDNHELINLKANTVIMFDKLKRIESYLRLRKIKSVITLKNK